MMTITLTPCTRERKMMKVSRFLSWRTVPQTIDIHFVFKNEIASNCFGLIVMSSMPGFIGS